MKRPILIVSTAYLPMVGGAELAIKEITERLSGKYEFYLVCARIKRELQPKESMGSISIRRVGFGLPLDKYLLPFYVALQGPRARRNTAVWAVMASYGAFGVPFFKILRPGTKFLLTLQEGDSEKHILRRVGIFYPAWKAVFKKADHIQVISKYLADFARRHGAVCPIEVVPNGVDVKEFKNQKPKTQNPKLTTVITTSRLVPKNGIDVLIRAIAELKTYNLKPITYKLLIVGGGPQEQELKILTRKLGVEDVVNFIGEVKPEKIPEYLAKADIFVRPSRSEGLGSSFLEAMAAGLAVIGTPVGGIPDFLKDGDTGLFAKVDDSSDLAQKIKLLLTDDELRQKLAETGRRLVLKNYTWDRVAGQMNDIFKKL